MAPASAQAISPSAKGKNASEATTVPSVRDPVSPAAVRASSAFHAASLAESTRLICPRADPDAAAVLAEDDGVRFDVLADGEGEFEIGAFGRARLTPGDDLEGVAGQAIVAALQQIAARERAHGHARRARVWHSARDQHADVILGGEDRLRFRLDLRSDDHLDEQLGDFARGRRVDGPVGRR